MVNTGSLEFGCIYSNKSRIKTFANCLFLISLFTIACDTPAATILIQSGDPGYYNNSIGNLLDLSNSGGDTIHQPFPIHSGDTFHQPPVHVSHGVMFPMPPNLSAANTILGDWLTNPTSLNSNWGRQDSIPTEWSLNTEVAVIYQFNTSHGSNVLAQFSVDNGIYIWLDGSYMLGARGPGYLSGIDEYTLSLGDLGTGTHYLQLILEDHGGSDGFNILVTSDEDSIAPPVPLPSTILLFGTGLLVLIGRKKQRQ
jgi:hypothetical protein